MEALKLPLALLLISFFYSNITTAADFRPDNPEEGLQFFPLKSKNLGLFSLDPTYARDLKTYYSRRQYPGSPPFIPHPVNGLEFEKNHICSSCHAKGGYVKKWNAYAPVTPHPDRGSCRQCHVAQVTNRLFREND